jgi:hypothetical protein
LYDFQIKMSMAWFARRATARQSARVMARTNARAQMRVQRRWGMMGLTGEQEPQEQQAQSDVQPAVQQQEDPVAVLKLRLAKGEITPEQYEQSIKLLQGQG